MPHKLLLADDSVTIQRVIELTFADEDVRVIAVGDGQQAIERITAEPPDIVLADVGMPQRDGYEVAEFIKERPELAHIPVLLLTGAFEPVDEARARAVRCDGVLAKPFEPQLLIARVKELLGRAPAVPPAVSREEAVASQAPPPEDDDLVLDARRLLESAPPRSAEADASVDDYFDRLDQAFANLAGTAAASRERQAGTRPQPDVSWAPGPSPVAEWPAAETAPPARGETAPTAAAPVRPASEALIAVPVADAFTALLHAESDGETPPPAALHSSVMVSTPALSEDTLDDIARRVVEHLGLRRDEIVQAVRETAERLVREEIARLKAAAK